MAGGKSNSSSITRYTGIQVQTSAQGVVIPIVWGKTRIATNLIWWSDFVSTPVKQGKGSKGGKSATSYTYAAAVILALCEGPLTGVGQVWADQNITTLADLGLTFFPGTATQLPWTFLTHEHPTEALSYAYTSYLANDSYKLGFSPTLPNHNFEAITPLSGTSAPGFVDCNPADIIQDFLTNPQYRLGPIAIDSTSLALYKTYCQAQGLFMSPALQNTEQVGQIIDRWAALTNTWIFWSGSAIKFVPLGDTAITANGVTYTPNLTIQYNLTSKDFKGSGKVTPSRADPADCPNNVKLEVKDRANSYNVAPVEWQDQALIDQYGPVDAPVTTAHEICDLTVASIVVQLLGQRGAFNRTQYAFNLGLEFLLLEPGDMVTLYDPPSGIDTPRTVRIARTELDSSGSFGMTAELFLQGIGSAVAVTQNSAASGGLNTMVDPGNINFPILFEPNSALTNGHAQLWLAISGGADWGGCSILVSFDDLTYVVIGTIQAAAWQGIITAALPVHADPDSTNTLGVDLTVSDSIMDTTATPADADAFRTLALVTPNVPIASGIIPHTNAEMIAYGTVVQGAGPNQFNLTYLRRGLYGTQIVNHPIGSNFSRFDLSAINGFGNSVFIYDLPSSYIGGPIYFKFASFNKFGNALQDISTLDSFNYTPTGAGYGTATLGLPATPTGLTGIGIANGVALKWDGNIVTDNTLQYQIWGATGTGTAFGSCALLYTGFTLNATIASLTASTAYTFYVVAVNSVGSSAPSTAFNATTGASGASTGPSYRAVTTAVSPITLLNSDNVVDVTNTSGAALTVKMPPAPTVGQRIVVMDASNTATAFPVTLKDNAGTTTLDVILSDGGWTMPRIWTGTAWRLTG